MESFSTVIERYLNLKEGWPGDLRISSADQIVSHTDKQSSDY